MDASKFSNILRMPMGPQTAKLAKGSNIPTLKLFLDMVDKPVQI